ncbi:g11687 [Coccomyxa viridis]|uniref:G11687 protein n=1 Tax=Coccomyxa viridis TaxID=1274662 RepID=A0ABP1GE61_9CHLO
MADFNPNPYRGEASIPHVSEDFFKVYFVGAQLALGILMFPGRILGSEVRPRKYNRDLVIAACDEAARKREARRGMPPRQFVHKPLDVTDSWPHKWHSHLHWKSWTIDRMGGGSQKSQ